MMLDLWTLDMVARLERERCDQAHELRAKAGWYDRDWRRPGAKTRLTVWMKDRWLRRPGKRSGRLASIPPEPQRWGPEDERSPKIVPPARRPLGAVES